MENKEKVRKFIEGNLVSAEEGRILSDDDNIFELGFVNSLFAMKIINYLEKEFNITIEADDMDIKNFNTINNMVQLINKKSNT